MPFFRHQLVVPGSSPMLIRGLFRTARIFFRGEDDSRETDTRKFTLYFFPEQHKTKVLEIRPRSFKVGFAFYFYFTFLAAAAIIEKDSNYFPIFFSRLIRGVSRKKLLGLVFGLFRDLVVSVSGSPTKSCRPLSDIKWLKKKFE